MAHITSHSDIDFPSPDDSDGWDEVSWASVNTAADGTGKQLFKDDITNFTAVENANVSIPSGDIDWEMPAGDEMPEDEILTAMNAWLARRVTGLALAANDHSDGYAEFTNDNGTVYVLLHTDDPGDAAANHLADATNHGGYTGGVAVTIGNGEGTAAVLRTASGAPA